MILYSISVALFRVAFGMLRISLSMDISSYLPTIFIKIVVNQSCYKFSCPNFTVFI